MVYKISGNKKKQSLERWKINEVSQPLPQITALTDPKNIYKNTKIPSTQQGKIHNVWQSIKTTRHGHAKIQENMTHNDQKKSINCSQPRTHTDIIISRPDIQTVIMTPFHVFKKSETQK